MKTGRGTQSQRIGVVIISEFGIFDRTKTPKSADTSVSYHGHT
jgi:hypothetical protein